VKIGIIGGAGHVGLPFAVVLAAAGYEVVAFDTDIERVRLVSNGTPPFYEPGLPELLKSELLSHRFRMVNDLEVLTQCEIIFVVVGTDLDEQEAPQNQSVFEAIRQVRRNLSPSTSIALRSTLMPGTTKAVSMMLGPDVAEVTYCPERIAEGCALQELREIPQVIGTELGQPSQKLNSVFESLGVKVITASWHEAELGKLILNAWRYSQFALANEFSQICEFYDTSFRQIRSQFLVDYPRGVGLMGPGFAGGPCLKKDTLQLLNTQDKASSLLNSVVLSHRRMLMSVVEQVIDNMESVDSTVIQLGLTFKPGSDDLRGSTAMELAHELAGKIKDFRVVEPYVSHIPRFTPVSLVEAMQIADVIVVGTRHPEFLGVEVGAPIIDAGGLRLINRNRMVF